MDETTEATQEHINKVREILSGFQLRLAFRKNQHDQSKLEEPEKSLFAKWSPVLSSMKYGSKEYMEALKEMGPALLHHYEHNRHHPEHFKHGVLDMNLFDLLEMIADWKAAAERVKDGNMVKSLRFNVDRFDIPSDLAKILANTIMNLGWGDEEE